MQAIKWDCCPLVRENQTMRAFIEQLARERKSPGTVENYSRDLNDFLTAFPDHPFSRFA
jgi:site-specific recombinase XerC